MADHLMTTYARLPVTFSHGDGVWLWDTEGKKYLDALGGIAVCGLGHSHPAVTKAICDQAGKLMHTSNLYGIGVQSELADELCRLSGLERVFFSNSGAEANEAAIKIARLFGHSKNISVPHIIVTEGSFHGRTLSTLSATGNPKVQAGFEPLVQGFLRVPYNDVDAIARLADNRDDVAAILVEPVTGEGGISIPDAKYLNELRKICDQHELLLMLDEIQTGMCRTGTWFAHQHNKIKPDVMTLAKSLGNGMPIGACLAGGKAANIFQPGNHGSTFGGNPLACSAALAVVKTMDADNLDQRATQLGQKFRQGFRDQLQGVAGIQDIRIKGLMIGIELNKDCGELVGQALERGLLINVTAGNVVRLLPALITNDDEAEQIISIVADLISNFLSQ
ncbi:MAG: aspartate aminotransferase family protein [Gammaproteobacteria bacterium]|nr:aspartate aminotransferase family protein [Gammaproteobacteria bacterium]